jgi:hypothetical protein
MPDKDDPRRRFLLEPDGLVIDGEPWASWYAKRVQAAAETPTPPAGSCPPPDDHPATALSGDSGPQAEDNLVFFDFDFE